jgi:hypothetical protein
MELYHWVVWEWRFPVGEAGLEDAKEELAACLQGD